MSALEFPLGKDFDVKAAEAGKQLRNGQTYP